MNLKTIFFALFLLFIGITISAQVKPQINLTYSKLLATYDFVKKLSDYKPDNKFKQVFQTSQFKNPYYSGLIKQLDTLNIFESYNFQEYPFAQKRPVMTTSLIERNLINASSIREFKNRTFGILPSSELFALSNILSAFEPIYDSLIYFPNKIAFEQKLKELNDFIKQSDLAKLFEKGLTFYNSKWDNDVLFKIAIIPSIENNGFTAKAFFNNAISEVPLSFKHTDVLFSVLMHEIYHTLYDEQSLQVKKMIEKWFVENPSESSQYAYLLLNEVLATALGNGHVYEQITGKVDSDDWYNFKYINLMAKKIYPIAKEYITLQKAIDKDFIDKYIALYDEEFSDWVNEAEHLFANRYVVTDNKNEQNYFSKNYPYSSYYQSATPIDRRRLEQMKQTPITKIVIVSSNNKHKLSLIKNTFSELKKWEYNPQTEFVYDLIITDKTKLIIVNSLTSGFKKLLDDFFKGKSIK